jgi:hypothetical protein
MPIITMLNSLRRSILGGDASERDDAHFVGTILEQHLREVFDQCPDSRLDDPDGGEERKRLDLAFLLVKESNVRRVSTSLRHSFEEFSEYRRLSLLAC